MDGGLCGAYMRNRTYLPHRSATQVLPIRSSVFKKKRISLYSVAYRHVQVGSHKEKKLRIKQCFVQQILESAGTSMYEYCSYLQIRGEKCFQ